MPSDNDERPAECQRGCREPKDCNKECKAKKAKKGKKGKK